MSRCCNDCPKFKISSVESDESIHSLKINFHIYEVFRTCSKHGVVGPGNFLSGICSNSVYDVKKTVKIARNMLTL